MLLRLLFLLISCIYCIPSNANPDTLQAVEWYEEAKRLRQQSQYKQAIVQLQKSIKVFHENAIWTQKIQATNEVAWNFFLLNEYKTAEDLLNDNLDEAKKRLDDNDIILADIYYCFSAVKSQQSKLDESIAFAEEAIRIAKGANPDTAKLAGYYNALGIAYQQKSDLQKALETQLLSLQIKQKNYPENDLRIAKTYNNLGVIYREMNEDDLAMDYYSKSIAIKRIHLGATHPNVAATYNNMAQLYSDRQQYDEALVLLRKALEIEKKAFGPESYAVAQKFGMMAFVLYETGDYDEALRLNLQTIAIWKKILRSDHTNISKALRHSGNIHLAKKEFQKSFSYYQQSLQTLLPDYVPEHIFGNPKASMLTDEPDLLTTLREKGEAHQKMYAYTRDVKDLKLALSTFQLASKVVDAIRIGYLEEHSKLLLQESASNLFGDGISVCYKLWTTTGKPKYIEMAFTFGEQNKSILLQESIRAEEAIQFVGIPDDVLRAEDLIKLAIVKTNNKIFAEKENSNNPDSIAYLQAKLYNLKEQHQQLLKKLEKQFPEYYQLKYERSSISISALQKQLAEKQEQLLEFFWGQDALYLFAVSPDTLLFRSISALDTLNQHITDFINLIHDPSIAKERGNDLNTFKKFYQLSTDLSSQLIAEAINPDQFSVLIIPDGLLYALPFELLLTHSDFLKDEVHYHDLPYLLKEHDIRYNYAASFIRNTTVAKSSSAKLIAFAPVYQSATNTLQATRDGFSNLEFTENEVHRICELTNGKPLTGQAANKSNFLDKADRFDVLHLAMHAFTDDEHPLFSGLVFSDFAEPKNSNVLYALELYNLQLKAQLAVLSACNTGNGKLARGEGIMSLARAFRHAGCPNILMSLWQADDETTGQIMESFYGHLQDQMPMAESLRLAKLDYLSQTSRKNFPFYWSTFVLLGNNDVIYFKDEFSVLPWIGGFLLLLVIVWLSFIRKIS